MKTPPFPLLYRKRGPYWKFFDKLNGRSLPASSVFLFSKQQGVLQHALLSRFTL